MVALRKPGMVERHWKQISDIVGFTVNPDNETDEPFNFQKVLDLGLMKHVEELVDVGERASKEFQIETMLREMQEQWETIFF